MQRLGTSLSIPEERRFAIFLTPGGRSPISGDPGNWRTVSYAAVAAAFGDLLPGITSDKVRIFLLDWIETVRAFGGGYGMAI
jgi:hypothetical protein